LDEKLEIDEKLATVEKNLATTKEKIDE